MKAKMLVDENCISDDDYPWGDERHKWHYELKIGDEVEVNMNIKADSMEVRNSPEGMCYLCHHHGKYQYLPITYLDIDFSAKDIDWEERRYELAKEAMSAILSNPKWPTEYSKEYFKKDVAGNALSYADELINQLMHTKCPYIENADKENV